jgi:hypothetical protein
MSRLWVVFSITPFFYVATGTEAFAYLDPSSGSMLLQGLIAFLAAGGAFVAMSWQRIRDFVRPKKSSRNVYEKPLE